MRMPTLSRQFSFYLFMVIIGNEMSNYVRKFIDKKIIAFRNMALPRQWRSFDDYTE